MNSNNYNLEQVGAAFDNWRSSRRGNQSPIPEDLWVMVDNIYHHYSRGSICSRLGLSSSQLKRRGYDVNEVVSTANTTKHSSAETVFVHVPPKEIAPVSSEMATGSPTIEIIRPDGTTIRLQHVHTAQLSQFFQQLVGG